MGWLCLPVESGRENQEKAVAAVDSSAPSIHESWALKASLAVVSQPEYSWPPRAVHWVDLPPSAGLWGGSICGWFLF